VGEGAGLALAIVLGRLRDARAASSSANRVAGAACGLTGALVVAWLAMPSLTALQGWPSRLAHGSFVAGALDDVAPRVSFSTALSSAIAQAPYQRPSHEAAPRRAQPPPSGALSRERSLEVRAAVVQVQSGACDVVKTGMGWVAKRSLVVTNAHVVAGNRRPTVEDASRRSHRAVVVAFDRRLDLAVLRVPDLHAARLRLGKVRKEEIAYVFGAHEAPAGVAGLSFMTDEDVRRHVYVLDARVREGDSGAPLVNARGEVAGVVFGDDGGTAYAITVDQVVPMLRDGGRGSTSAGRCEP
jgi:S1-C subfamily serine protease